MTKVLIVYENVPESTDLYIVDADENDLKDLNLAHGNYINACDDEEIEKAMARISVNLGGHGSEPNGGVIMWAEINLSTVGKWRYCKVDSDLPISIKEAGVEMVVVTGWVM